MTLDALQQARILSSQALAQAHSRPNPDLLLVDTLVQLNHVIGAALAESLNDQPGSLRHDPGE